MVIRFFALLIRHWTYEIEFRLEIARMIFIQILVIVLIPLSGYLFPDSWRLGVFGKIVLIFDFLLWVYLTANSVLRIVGISKNKKNIKIISSVELHDLLSKYPGIPLYTKIGKKYRIIKCNNDFVETQSIVLISIGKESLDAEYYATGIRKNRRK